MKRTIVLTLILVAGIGIGALGHMVWKADSDHEAQSAPKSVSYDEFHVASALVDDDTNGLQRPNPFSSDKGSQWQDALRRLDEESAKRQMLEDELAALRRELLSLRQRLGDGVIEPSVVAVGDASVAKEDANGQISVDSLVSLGFSQHNAESLKKRVDQADMERLYLRDRAIREGWLGSKRYADSLREIQQREKEVLDELSEDDYDRYLYATGQTNRVIVSSVMAGSPAELAGLAPLDVILSYAGVRIFDWNKLRQATSEGAAGEQVAVEVLRGDQRELFYLSRGPMGVKLDSASMAPTSSQL